MCLLTLFGLVGAPASRAGLVNGDFSTFVPSNGTGGGWTSLNIDAAGGHRTTGGNPGGTFILNSNGGATDPTIRQTVSNLTIGSPYLISGEYRVHAALGNPGNSFGVLLDGFAILSLGSPGTVFTPFSVEFVATSTSHSIGFAAERNGSDHSYLIDNLALAFVPPPPPPPTPTSVPEPATFSAAAVGVVVLGRSVRQRARTMRG